MRFVVITLTAVSQVVVLGYVLSLYCRVFFIGGAKYIGADVLCGVYSALLTLTAISVLFAIKQWAPKIATRTILGIGSVALILIAVLHASGMISVFSKP
jgi:hypothetical protein